MEIELTPKDLSYLVQRAREWRDYRIRSLDTSIKSSDYRAVLNSLSNAESNLSDFVMSLEIKNGLKSLMVSI